MLERDSPSPDAQKLQFGTAPPVRGRRVRLEQSQIIPEVEDLPLFSGTPQEMILSTHQPDASMYMQRMLPGMQEINWDTVLEADRRLRAKRTRGTIRVEEQRGSIWKGPNSSIALNDTERAEELRAIFQRYQLDIPRLRQLVAKGRNIHEALRSANVPEELQYLLQVLTAVFTPLPDERIRSPADVAALLMTEMVRLDQEQLRVLCLTTKNRLQKMHLVYQGSLNTAMIRVGEVYKEPLRLNSASIIVAHNHPSGDPTPSPEDVLVTQQIVKAGMLLEVDCLDHLVIGQGQWISMRERGLGFDQ